MAEVQGVNQFPGEGFFVDNKEPLWLKNHQLKLEQLPGEGVFFDRFPDLPKRLFFYDKVLRREKYLGEGSFAHCSLLRTDDGGPVVARRIRDLKQRQREKQFRMRALNARNPIFREMMPRLYGWDEKKDTIYVEYLDPNKYKPLSEVIPRLDIEERRGLAVKLIRYIQAAHELGISLWDLPSLARGNRERFEGTDKSDRFVVKNSFDGPDIKDLDANAIVGIDVVPVVTELVRNRKEDVKEAVSRIKFLAQSKEERDMWEKALDDLESLEYRPRDFSQLGLRSTRLRIESEVENDYYEKTSLPERLGNFFTGERGRLIKEEIKKREDDFLRKKKQSLAEEALNSFKSIRNYVMSKFEQQEIVSLAGADDIKGIAPLQLLLSAFDNKRIDQDRVIELAEKLKLTGYSFDERNLSLEVRKQLGLLRKVRDELEEQTVGYGSLPRISSISEGYSSVLGEKEITELLEGIPRFLKAFEELPKNITMNFAEYIKSDYIGIAYSLGMLIRKPEEGISSTKITRKLISVIEKAIKAVNTGETCLPLSEEIAGALIQFVKTV